VGETSVSITRTKEHRHARSDGWSDDVTTPPVLDVLEEIITAVVEPGAGDVDAHGSFPRAAVTALGQAGILGLLSSTDGGGSGGSLADAAAVVRRLAGACGSTAMVVCMHFSAAAVIEQFGPDDVRGAIASGRHLTTLAFSETGSRSQFWAPLGTATVDGGDVVLDASKSWVTSAGEADSYVWSSRATSGAGATLWLVPADAPGLEVAAPFDGLGLRGNASSPVLATGVRVPVSARLGADGAGIDLALGIVLPVFQILNASCSLGMMDAGIAKAIGHVTTARLEHLGQTLADQPVVRQHVAAMKDRADAASTLVDDAVVALAGGRADAPLRMLQSKAVAGGTALDVLDLAMQVGGGAAFRKDVGIERHFRDARASAVMAPTVDALQDFIGRAVCGLPLFG
jgi:alkylation response protein AidB-like acyl-CoA dehydrogenase